MKRLLPMLLLVLLVGCKREAPEPEVAAHDAPGAAVAEKPAQPAEVIPAGNQVPRAFLCRGNEPFWSLDIRADGALLKTPESEAALDGGFAAKDGGTYAFRGAPDGSPDDLVEALISPAQCFDTMADGPASPFSVEVGLPGGQSGTGCCSVEYGIDLDIAPVFDAASKSESDWSHDFEKLSASLGTCARDSGVATDVVTTAWVEEDKGVVWLRDSSEQRYECRTELESGRIYDIRPVKETEIRAGDGSPLWFPTREGPPVLTCGRVERVMLGGDALIGYLHYTEGCGG